MFAYFFYLPSFLCLDYAFGNLPILEYTKKLSKNQVQKVRELYTQTHTEWKHTQMRKFVFTFLAKGLVNRNQQKIKHF